MGRTIAEQILSAHSGGDARAGDFVLADVDLVFFHDASRPHPIEILKEMGGDRVFNPDQVIGFIDHYPSPTDVVARRQQMVRQFAAEQGIRLYPLGSGISHTILPEQGHIIPGQLVLGGDSHSCTHGALNTFATGMGTTDIAAALIAGQQWFRVPETIKFVVRGEWPRGVYAKDLILYLIGEMTADGATYMSLEFVGEAIEALSVEARLTISNMAIEMGAKTGLMEIDATARAWLADRVDRDYVPVYADDDATYARSVEVDVSRLAPQVARPHAVDNVAPISAVEGTPIQQGVLGTCTAARLEDFHVAASILAGEKVHPGTRFFIVPSSKPIFQQIVQDGTLQVLLDAGAVMGVPGCSGCMGGAAFAVPADGTNTITTANRNFKGRTGNPNAFIYLASPATVAASVLEGRIVAPADYIKEG